MMAGQSGPTFGVNLPTMNPVATPEVIFELSRIADRRGFERVWIGEHVVLADEDSNEYFPATAPMPDNFILLSGIAAITSQIRLGTGICVLPQRNPVYVAKQAATVDWMSGGRFDLGIGLGWSRTEAAAVDTDWASRSERTSDAVEVIRHLWRDANAERTWPTYRLPAVRQFPRPAQESGPPIWIGGNSDAALRRVAECGDGWYGFELADDDLRERLAALDSLLAERGRRRGDVQIGLLTYRDIGAADAASWSQLGVDHVVVSPSGESADDILASLDRLADNLLPAEPR